MNLEGRHLHIARTPKNFSHKKPNVSKLEDLIPRKVYERYLLAPAQPSKQE